MSQRKLAERIGIDPAAVSYMLKGTRNMSIDEVRKISDVLLVPATEVMRQAGIEILDDVRKIPVKGYSNEHNLITLYPTGTYDMVIAPADMPPKSYVIQHRKPNTPFDGWHVYVSGDRNEPEEMIDHYSLVSLKDGRITTAIIRRGYRHGSFNLVQPTIGDKMWENEAVAWVSRVFWVQPS